ncbi:hypothetical protein RFI_40336, partial [Reticulomyxa filosa]
QYLKKEHPSNNNNNTNNNSNNNNNNNNNYNSNSNNDNSNNNSNNSTNNPNGHNYHYHRHGYGLTTDHYLDYHRQLPSDRQDIYWTEDYSLASANGVTDDGFYLKRRVTLKTLKTDS